MARAPLHDKPAAPAMATSGLIPPIVITLAEVYRRRPLIPVPGEGLVMWRGTSWEGGCPPFRNMGQYPVRPRGSDDPFASPARRVRHGLHLRGVRKFRCEPCR